ILIILVMVVGQRARSAPTTQAAQRAEDELQGAVTECINVERHVHEMAAQMAAVRGELAARAAERDAVNTLVVALERQVAERRKPLERQQRDTADIVQQRELAIKELEDAQS